MTRSIRVRVALGVFAVVVSLLLAQNYYVLDRFERGFREEVDDKLDEELMELRGVLGSDQLAGWIENAVKARSGDQELFVEVLDASGAVVARSANVPPAGIPGAAEAAPSKGTQYWETSHPRSRSGARHIRGAETVAGPWRLRVALSLEQMQRSYWNLRGNLATSLLLIALLGAFAAWGVAARALRPVSEMAARARSLGALPEGSLPHSGSGDEIDRLAEVLNDLLQRIRDEVLRVRRLTVDVGHALRTPLTAIRGNLELQIGRSDGTHAEALATSLEQVDDLVRLVNQLLLLEKLESPPLGRLARERVDLHALARGLVEHLHVLADERGVVLELHGEPVFVEADAGQVRQALANLIDNALRHTPRGGRVGVETRSAGDLAQLRVADTGPGVPADQLERVFERFYSAPGEAGGGTGLGLPLARAIARAHGGDITATSPGGALFTFEIPRATTGSP